MTRATSDAYLAQGGNRQLLAQAVLRAREADQFEAWGLYRTYLGRPADADGLSTWVNFLHAGGRDETLAALFLQTDEFFFRANHQ
jgi:hypothetical protein